VQRPHAAPLLYELKKVGGPRLDDDLIMLRRECEVCFDLYSAEKRPLKLFCCQKTICEECLNQVGLGSTTVKSCVMGITPS